MTKDFEHIPVLKNEVIKSLNIKDGGVYVDGTAGRGGHVDAVLSSANAAGLEKIVILAIQGS